MEIYAEISNNMKKALDSDNYELDFPPGVSYKRKKGSRAVYIDVDDETLATEVMSLLHESGIPFQDYGYVDGIEEVEKPEKYANVEYGTRGDSKDVFMV
jgi:hypothetical protein